MLKAIYSTSNLLKDLLVMAVVISSSKSPHCYPSIVLPSTLLAFQVVRIIENLIQPNHQETPPITLGGLLSAPHPADTLPEHLYSKCTTCVRFLFHCPTASCILHAPASGLCCVEAHPLPTTKEPSEASRELHTHTGQQTKVNTMPDAAPVRKQGIAYWSQHGPAVQRKHLNL